MTGGGEAATQISSPFLKYFFVYNFHPENSEKTLYQTIPIWVGWGGRGDFGE